MASGREMSRGRQVVRSTLSSPIKSEFMDGKVVVVTGANAGIGFETARALAGKGAEMVMICRNAEKGEAARAQIRQATGNDKLHLLQADLASQRQIREAAARIRDRYAKLDVLVNNAGTWFSELVRTEDGIETVFAVNHLAYFLLTHELHPLLAAAGDARIVNVGSDSHFKGEMQFDDIHLTRNYHGLRSYAQSKLANVLFTYEYERRKPHDHVAINCVQPGLVYTDIGVKHTTWLHALAWKARRSLWKSKTPAEGAATSVYLASHPEAAGVSGKYWDDKRPKPSAPASYDEAAALRLWELSEELCGIEQYF